MVSMTGKTSVTVRPDQAAELARVSRILSAAEDRRVTIADAIDRLLDLWRQATNGKAKAT